MVVGRRFSTFILLLPLHNAIMALLVGGLEKPMHSCILLGRVLDEIGKATLLGPLLARCLVCWPYLSTMASLVGKESYNLSG